MDVPSNSKMADAEAEPDAKRPCSAMVTLRPLKCAANLRERYTQDTADVFFVNVETKERLPAHREVLKVASAVFFKMFSGNWKEKEEKEIPAPEEYKWESFKAAITLLYGEEVEVEESCIPDVYRVAHCYDLTGVLAILAQEVCKWGGHLLGTVVELCGLAGDVPERSDDLLDVAVQYIAHNLEKVSTSYFLRFSFETMQRLVQSEAVKSTELVLLRTVNQWTNAQMDITLRQMKQLYSHIRFGTIPFEDLTECSEIGHDYLKSALKNHQHLVVENVRNNLVQITPRLAQKEVFQVYPMAQGVRAVVQQNGRIYVSNVSCNPSFGVTYCGKQVVRFQVDLRSEKFTNNILYCSLYSLHYGSVCYHDRKKLWNTLSQRCELKHDRGVYNTKMTMTLDYLQCTVVLSPMGAHVLLQSKDLPTDHYPQPSAAMVIDFPCTWDFPWLFAFGGTCGGSNPPMHFIIHPPTL